MSRPKIKVCGVTNLENALDIEKAGVHYIGFNFIPASKRYIDPIEAFKIIKSLTTSIPVGIFMNQSFEYIAECIAVSGIKMVQLHGAESPALCSSFDVPVIKVFSIDESFDQLSVNSYNVEYFLFDAKVGHELGGTGHSFNWKTLADINSNTPYFLAGGIGPDNIEEAVKTTKPFALDLNSKIESVPGIKEISLLKKCISAVNDHFSL
jgi:phosphoribosylanthranilate isomerase